MSNIETGILGEKLAYNYLSNNDYTILEKNFRAKVGEIDIIAKKNEVIVFIEVKTRNNNNYGRPYESVNYRKQHKIVWTAQSYINLKKLSNYQFRFDIIEVYLKPNIRINHIQNAFWL
ncbi:putative endonuclease [Proteiniborus ethanoligenes]|uniref:UPF0102 protein SAMN05660462_01575 n=1 Tax=Proteiniborus ethanoligenes TaxID=415015 RepID=A0A1H3PN97_9FIRM|nr:YraN family protein [Proteiniborus ethanoligenes]SDZ02498.1 putative endonuclease [Proteiniborus ethanoligenes]